MRGSKAYFQYNMVRTWGIQVKDLCIVIPAYLEEENLRLILPRISNVLRSMSIDYEILVIDTCEPMDQTPNVCTQYLDVRYINRIPGNFYGDAVRTGIREAKGKGDGSL